MSRIALAQPKVEPNNPGRNLETALELISRASQESCAGIVFPEMFLTGYELGPNLVHFNLDDPHITAFSDISAEMNIEIIFGAPLNLEKKVNGALLARPARAVELVATKSRLFDFAGEHRYFYPGPRSDAFEFCNLKTFVNICYDIRFWDSCDVDGHSVDLFINLASWPLARFHQYLSLLTARSMDLQTVAIGVNRSGIDTSKNSYAPTATFFTPDGVQHPLDVHSEFLTSFESSSPVIASARLPFCYGQTHEK